jgi:hypothetical protein
MAADKSLFGPAQSADKAGMTRPGSVTPVQWLALLAVWGLVAYGALAKPAETRRDPVRLIACR